MFELHQTAAASEAARRAGFERIELIQEPVASAIAAGWTQGGSNGPWLVYDLGGGTFDVSLLETRDGLLRVVGHDGDNFLGGRDFDRALVDLALARLSADGIVIDRANPRHAPALRRLRLAAEEAKIERRARADLRRAGVDGQSVDVDTIVTRSEHETATGPLIDRSLNICTRSWREWTRTAGLNACAGRRTDCRPAAESVRSSSAGLRRGPDPMTLVAQGVLFAGTVALDGRPAVTGLRPQGRRSGCNSAMTSDPSPFVVGVA